MSLPSVHIEKCTPFHCVVQQDIVKKYTNDVGLHMKFMKLCIHINVCIKTLPL